MTHRGFVYNAVAAVALALPSTLSADMDVIDLYPDTWVAIDGIDRVLPTSEDCPLRTDKNRTVGIFYVSWHYDWFYTNFKSPYASDVTNILQEDPNARLDYNHRLWTHEFAYHWGEPELGYFTSCDPYVIRKDISMLTDAGVDVLILDCTNGVCYVDEWNALLSVMTDMKKEGNVVPKVCFWGYNNEVAKRLYDIYEYYYLGERYKDLWFYWDGKPLLLYNEEADYPQSMRDFFTLRHMWWGYYSTNGKRYVGTEDHWSFGYDMHDPQVKALAPAERASLHNGRYEQMAVTPAQHASTMVGKSWTLASGEPTLNEYDLPRKKFLNKKWIDNPEYYGFYFNERWDEALSVDPDFIYINDWNEWIAGQFPTPDGVNFMGRQSNYHFVDQYNAEFNRTIQPMKGGGTDNYYMQMVDGIRRYKGVREAPVASVAANLDINSDFSLWNRVEETFYDTPGDVTHRDYTGYGGNKYYNTSGRNDILISKVNVNGGKISFYVETASSLTPYTDPNWMLLFVNTDCDFKTGWHGFDFLINKEFESDTMSYVMKWDTASSQWVKSGLAEFRTEENRLVIEMPMSALGMTESEKGNFYFKWADNPEDIEDPISLCVNGDTAPNRRFCYNYRWDYASTMIEDLCEAKDNFCATSLDGNRLYIESGGNFSVSNVLGLVMASGSGSQTVTLPSAGIYIVTSLGRSVKVLVR